MEAAVDTRVALAAVSVAAPAFRSCTDTALLAETESWEAIGRLVDARRIEVAAELERRSRPSQGEQSLAFQQGRKDGATLLSAVARVTHREATRRVGLGTALAPRWSLTGEPLPARFPVLAAAVCAGEVGLESARRIMQMFQSVRKRADPSHLSAAEVVLTDWAREIDPELLRVHLGMWQDRLDPDGPEPREKEQRLRRRFRFGGVDSSGGSTFTGYATAEDRAVLSAAFQAHRRQIPVVRVAPGGEDSEALEAHWVEAEGERRTLGQADYDTLLGMVTAGIRAELDGACGTIKTPHEVIVQVSAEAAAARRGSGWAEGVAARLSIPTIERIGCTGAVRLAVLDGSGEPLHLGPKVRLFTSGQKKALTARYGGCAWPGCTAPSVWTDAHHITWWNRDDGPTNIAPHPARPSRRFASRRNRRAWAHGVLLCSHHHHLIHAGRPRWRIVVHEREPHLIPHAWRGPPERRHRMQRHPAQLLPPPEDDDPWTTPSRQ